MACYSYSRGWRACMGGVLARVACWRGYCIVSFILYCTVNFVLFFLFVCLFFSILYFTSIVIVYNSYTVQNNIIIKIDGSYCIVGCALAWLMC